MVDLEHLTFSPYLEPARSSGRSGAAESNQQSRRAPSLLLSSALFP